MTTINQMAVKSLVCLKTILMAIILGFVVEKKRKIRLMDVITAQTREKALKLLTAANNPCCSSDEVVYLPEEVIVEILCKLPVKSLLRFKTVCKAWKLLINSYVFIDKHLHRPNPQLGGYPVRTREKAGNIFPVEIRYVVGVCNGILCLRALDYPKSLILFNPATREFSWVPNEPRIWNFAVFCYLPKTQKYQIVCFTYVGGVKHVDITTLTLGKVPSQSVVKNIMLPGRITRIRSYTTCGSTKYWLGWDEDDDHEIVICYDVIEGRFSVINMPPTPCFLKEDHRSLRMFKGSLITFVSPTKECTSFDIWMLIDDVSNGKSWMKYRKVGPLKTFAYPIEVCWDNRWILFRNNPSTRHHIRENLFYYDLATDQVKEYCDIHPDQVYNVSLVRRLILHCFPCKETHLPILEFINYVESLVPINSLVPYVDTSFPQIATNY